MNRFLYLSSALFLSVSNSSCVKDKIDVDKPNLLVIMTDEHSIRTLGCYREHMAECQRNLWGSSLKIETPNIDRLASEGALCLNFFTSAPVSTPARASFQTGLYPPAAGAPINGMPKYSNINTFADVLSENGYSTTYVGKWHLAGVPKIPGRMYYEPGFSFGWQNRNYKFETDHEKWYKVKEKPNRIYITNKNKEGDDAYEYSTDFLTNKVIELLEEGGLINVHTEGSEHYLLVSELPDVERYSRMYYDLSINKEGIDAIHHLLERMEEMKREMDSLRKQLTLYRKREIEDTDR